MLYRNDQFFIWCKLGALSVAKFKEKIFLYKFSQTVGSLKQRSMFHVCPACIYSTGLASFSKFLHVYKQSEYNIVGLDAVFKSILCVLYLASIFDRIQVAYFLGHRV